MVKNLIASSVLVVVLAASTLAQSPICQENDIAIALSAAGGNYKYYDASANSWSTPSAFFINQMNWQFGSNDFGPNYTQGLEWDNFDGVYGIPTGNLLCMNYGSAYTGAEIYNLATDGSAEWSTLWSIKYETGGAKTTRGVGLSINPSGTKVAWMNYDGDNYPGSTGSQIWVLDYVRGTNPGKGFGIIRSAGEADIRGPRVTGDRVGIGNAGKTGTTQGTTWLSDDVVLCFNGFGQLVAWDVSNVPAGQDRTPRIGAASSYMAPSVDNNWEVVNEEVAFSAQYTCVEYIPAIDPYKIFASVTRTTGGYQSSIFMFSYNGDPQNPVITLIAQMDLHPALNTHEPREFAFDKAGNLYWTNYAGSGSDNICSKLAGGFDPDNWTPANLSVFGLDGEYSPYNGMDVATNLADTCAGDANRDGLVDDADFGILLTNWGTGNTWFEGDFNGDLIVDDADFGVLLTNWGACD